MGLSTLDLFLVGVYLVGVTAFGVHFRKSQHSVKDYFLAGRRLPWWAISFSIVCAETSVLTLISTPGIGYTSNLNFLQLALGYLVARFLVSFILIPRYFAGRVQTAYQLIDQRFGGPLKVFTAGLFLITRSIAEGIRVFAISIVLDIILDTNVFVAVVLVTLLTVVYTFAGGMAAVVWTDVLQMILYLGGTLVALALILSHLPGGWSEVMSLAQSNGDKLSLFDFHFNFQAPYLFWAGLIGGIFLSSASHGTDQLIVQRLLAARTERESKMALIMSGVIVLLQFALFLVVGVALFAYFDHFPPSTEFGRPDQVFPYFVVHHLPTGLVGLMIAAMLATAMSTSSAALNSLASSSIHDFYRAFIRPDADEKHYLRMSRLVTLGWGGVIIGVALGAQYFERSVLELALSVASVPYGSLLGIFLLGVLSKTASARSTFIGALAGLVALSTVIIFTSVAWTWYTAIGATTTFLCGMALSRWEARSRSAT